MATTVTSMATKSSDLDDQTSGANFQTDGHTPIPSRGWEDPEETSALDNAPSHSPSWSPVRKPSPSHPDTWHCLVIHITLTKETGARPPPPHAWTVPVVEDMLCHGRTGLTEAIVTGPGWAVPFYGRWSLGEGLSLGEARDTMFTLTGADTWVGKAAYLAADPFTIQAITQAIKEWQIEVRGPEKPRSQPSTPQPFRFHCSGDSPWKECSRNASFDHQSLPCRPQRGQDCDCCWRDQRPIQPQPPSPSPDHGFKSNRSLVLTASSVSSLSDRSEGSLYSWCGRWHRKTRAHMKINLPIFKDEDTKDAITYQSWRWDLTVYHHAGCWDCTLLPYTIQCLQGYPAELVRS